MPLDIIILTFINGCEIWYDALHKAKIRDRWRKGAREAPIYVSISTITYIIVEYIIEHGNLSVSYLCTYTHRIDSIQSHQQLQQQYSSSNTTGVTAWQWNKKNKNGKRERVTCRTRAARFSGRRQGRWNRCELHCCVNIKFLLSYVCWRYDILIGQWQMANGQFWPLIFSLIYEEKRSRSEYACAWCHHQQWHKDK